MLHDGWSYFSDIRNIPLMKWNVMFHDYILHIERPFPIPYHWPYLAHITQAIPVTDPGNGGKGGESHVYNFATYPRWCMPVQGAITTGMGRQSDGLPWCTEPASGWGARQTGGGGGWGSSSILWRGLVMNGVQECQAPSKRLRAILPVPKWQKQMAVIEVGPHCYELPDSDTLPGESPLHVLGDLAGRMTGKLIAGWINIAIFWPQLTHSAQRKASQGQRMCNGCLHDQDNFLATFVRECWIYVVLKQKSTAKTKFTDVDLGQSSPDLGSWLTLPMLEIREGHIHRCTIETALLLMQVV